MTKATLLAGSLSNDLLRAVKLQQRGSTSAAQKFLLEAKRWAKPLVKNSEKPYIQKIAQEVANSSNDLSDKMLEKYLMYSTLLQNYVLHTQDSV